MTSREFCYWLQGYFEIKDKGLVGSVETFNLSPYQVEMIQKHLSLVFKHEIDPSYSDDPKVQEEMNVIHSAPHIPVRPVKIGGEDAFGNKIRC